MRIPEQKMHFYQDLDGCLSNFVLQVEIEINKLVQGEITIESKSLKRALRKYIATYGKSYRKMTNDDLKCKITRQVMYKVAAQEGFFRRLQPIDNGLWEVMKDYQYAMSFLTAPIGQFAEADKKAWCKEVLESDCYCHVVPRIEKIKFADKNSILIDDHPTTCAQWRTAGGLAFQWPVQQDELFAFLKAYGSFTTKNESTPLF